MRARIFLIGSIALLFSSFLQAQNLPQIPATKASWEFSANYGGGMRSFQAVQGAAATEKLPSGLGLGMISYQVVFANKWLIAAEAGFAGDHHKKSHRRNNYYQNPTQNVSLSQGSLIGGYNFLKGEKFRLFGVAGIGGGSVALNPDIYGASNNLNRTSYSSFQVGLMGQYVVKLGKLRAYNTYGRRNCCCCACNQPATEPKAEETAPKRYIQWVMPISFSLTFHKARSNDQDNNPNNLVTAAPQTFEEINPALTQTSLSTDSYYKNFSGVSFSVFVGFGAQRRNTIVD